MKGSYSIYGAAGRVRTYSLSCASCVDPVCNWRSLGSTILLGLLCSSLLGAADPWADEVVDASPELDGSGLYNDPDSVLGRPATTYYDMFSGQQFTVSLVSSPFYLDAPDGNKLITTVDPGQFIKVRFDDPVEDHPRNPHGIDLIVFGNSFFLANTFPSPDTDMETLFLLETIFAERVIVAVSPSGVGDPQTNPEHWYVYDTGPFSDDMYPTNACAWDRDAHEWGDPLDFTTPVDPSLQLTDFAGGTAAEAINLYECSGGGTGYDLAHTGFTSISYVYLFGEGGEVDALADVFPSLGDFDRDEDVDLLDFARFQGCFNAGERSRLPCKCRSADFDATHTVGLADYARMSAFLTGPS